nr:immunoglobulin light chain junction region [Macaca mulatta]MOV74329.1 immunoglobulin light chain junction region [Macaca mulatta]MOV74795.1 immunoglobulin light chain junction region [Macaca mulatta]MOV74803.1 immunoglobulin light chain junction region [Macaca mulatta]MOV74847.1 immunoglobulin light chain junction region [Macaca mulatta]
CQQESNWPFTF